MKQIRSYQRGTVSEVSVRVSPAHRARLERLAAECGSVRAAVERAIDLLWRNAYPNGRDSDLG